MPHQMTWGTAIAKYGQGELGMGIASGIASELECAGIGFGTRMGIEMGIGMVMEVGLRMATGLQVEMGMAIGLQIEMGMAIGLHTGLGMGEMGCDCQRLDPATDRRVTARSGCCSSLSTLNLHLTLALFPP